jgi:hypothetical protein
LYGILQVAGQYWSFPDFSVLFKFAVMEDGDFGLSPARAHGFGWA